ncbi:MAG: acyltransferase domain-containing protein, partial [Lentisphaeria bacterium]
MDMDFQNFNSLAEALGIDSAGRELWAGGWAQSQETYPYDGVYFLQENFINELAELSSLQENALLALQQAARQIRDNDMLSRFAWHMHWRMNLAAPEDGFFPSPLPQPGTPLPCENGHLFTLATLAPLPRLKKYYSLRGISQQVLRDTMHDLQVWTEAGFKKTGHYVCHNNNWLRNHMIPNLFALGRLEFQFGSWHDPIQVFKHRQNKQLCFLARGNEAISAEGFRFGNPGEQTAFQTFYREENQQVAGYPANVGGTLEKTPVVLDLTEWELVLKAGEPILHLHIPAGAPLRKEDCIASLEEAWQFFP